MINFKEWKEREEGLLLEFVDEGELESLLMQAKVEPNQEWVAQVMELLQPNLHRLSRKYRLSHSDAQDVLQIALLNITRNLQGNLGTEFQPGHTKGWLNSILNTAAVDFLRKDIRHRNAVQSSEELDVARTQSPSEKIEREEKSEQIKKTLNMLPPLQRQAIVMNYFHGMNYPQIAHQLNIPVGTVKSRIFVGMKRLEELIKFVV